MGTKHANWVPRLTASFNKAAGAILIALVAHVSSLSCFAQLSTEYQTNRPPAKRVAGAAFKAQISKTIGFMKTERQPVNLTLRLLANDQNVSIILDRRIDREKQIQRNVRNQSLTSAIAQIAEDVDAGTSRVGNVFYVGPIESAAKLRTLVAIKTAAVESLGGKQRLQLAKSRPLHWSDLESAREIITACADGYSLSIDSEQLKAIPHDLWQWNSVANVNACEALSLLLIQFDKTFEINARAIRIVDVPKSVGFEKNYRVNRRTTLAKAVGECERKFGPGKAVAKNRQLNFNGTIEEHELVKWIAVGKKPPTEELSTDEEAKKLARHRFSLPAQTTSAMNFIAGIQKTLDIQFDRKQFETAGIDLNQPIRFEFKDATVDEMCKFLCGKIKAKYSISGSTIRIEPQ